MRQRYRYYYDLEKSLIDFDRKCVTDLGLKMPRATKKYRRAVAMLSRIHSVSPYFVHVAAARRGTQAVYNELESFGYTWESYLGCWSTPV